MSRTSKGLSCAICFFVLTTVVYGLVCLYGNWQYDCLDIFKGQFDVQDNSSEANFCHNCERYIYTPFVTKDSPDILISLLYVIVFLNHLSLIIGIKYLYIGHYERRLSYTACCLIVSVMTSSSTYALWLDTGYPTVTLAISTNFHVFVETYFSLVSIINLLKMFSPIATVNNVVKNIEKNKLVMLMISFVTYLSMMMWFIYVNPISLFSLSEAVIQFAGIANIVTHYFLNILWIQYMWLPDDDDFVVEVENSLGGASDYIMFCSFGIHTLGTTLHPLVDSKISLTGDHNCNSPKTDMIIRHGPLSLLESGLMIYFWKILYEIYCVRKYVEKWVSIRKENTIVSRYVGTWISIHNHNKENTMNQSHKKK